MRKLYTNVSLMATPTADEHIVNKKFVEDLVDQKLKEILGNLTEKSDKESPSDKG